MLHIVNKSHTERNALSSALRLAQPGQQLLLIEDGVIAASAACAEASGIAAAVGTLEVFALLPDLQARGLAERVAPGVKTVDYAGFVALVAAAPRNQSWL